MSLGAIFKASAAFAVGCAVDDLLHGRIVMGEPAIASVCNARRLRRRLGPSDRWTPRTRRFRMLRRRQKAEQRMARETGMGVGR